MEGRLKVSFYMANLGLNLTSERLSMYVCVTCFLRISARRRARSIAELTPSSCVCAGEHGNVSKRAVKSFFHFHCPEAWQFL